MQWHTIAVTTNWIAIINEIIQILLISCHSLAHLYIPFFSSVGDLWQKGN